MSVSDRLNVISKETVEIAKEVIPSIGKVPPDDYLNYEYLVHELMTLTNKIIPSKAGPLGESSQGIFEFLDTLKSIVFRFSTYSKESFPNISKERLKLVQTKIDQLIEELNSPPFLQHHKRTPSEETEPIRP